MERDANQAMNSRRRHAAAGAKTTMKVATPCRIEVLPHDASTNAPLPIAGRDDSRIRANPPEAGYAVCATKGIDITPLLTLGAHVSILTAYIARATSCLQFGQSSAQRPECRAVEALMVDEIKASMVSK